MSLPLADPLWSQLESAYGRIEPLLGMFEVAHDSGLTTALLGDIVNEIQHQGDSSSAMYGAAGHLVDLAAKTAEPLRLQIFVHVGLIHCSAAMPDSVRCPKFLEADFAATKEVTLMALRESLTGQPAFEDLKYRFAALAGLLGHARFGFLLEGFDDFEGRFHHTELDEPFP